MKRLVMLIAVLAVTSSLPLTAAEQGAQSQLNPVKAQESRKYPQIVAYTVAWCPHCRAAKEYLTHNNIPFINRDVEQDPQAMTILTTTYKSQGVPVIVIGTGKDEIVLRGFNEEAFNEALKKTQAVK